MGNGDRHSPQAQDAEHERHQWPSAAWPTWRREVDGDARGVVRPRHTVARALEILAAGSGAQWDPRLTAAFATSSLPQRIAGTQGEEARIA